MEFSIIPDVKKTKEDALINLILLIMEKTLYDQIGGFVSVRKIILEFYNRVLDEEELRPYFKTVDMERQIDHQTKFISMLLGGPASYTDKHLEYVHKRLNIQNSHFDLIKDILEETLEDFDFIEEHINILTGEFEKRRDLIVSQ